MGPGKLPLLLISLGLHLKILAGVPKSDYRIETREKMYHPLGLCANQSGCRSAEA
jgi:hypothetical protein